MWQTLLPLMVLCAAFGHGLAISCYYRSSSTSAADGSTISGCSYCYAYTDYSGRQYAGCASSATSCSIYSYTKSCVICDTSLCNSLSGSSITCYSRITSLSANGTATTCSSGIRNCYVSLTDGEAGCGSCSSTDNTCKTCSTSMCNYDATLKCYSMTASGPRSVDSCKNSCYSYSSGSYYVYYYSGCGTCNSLLSNCRVCTTDYCNDYRYSAASIPLAMPGAAAGMLLLALCLTRVL